MKTFDSAVKIQRPVNEVYGFLADMNNHKDLMPENVIDWKSTADEATFSIKNMAKLSVKIGSRVENKRTKMLALTNPPLEVQLKRPPPPAVHATSRVFSLPADCTGMRKP